MDSMPNRPVTCARVREHYLREDFLRYLLRVASRRRVVLCSASEPHGRHQLCRPRLLAESMGALREQIASWLDTAFAGLGPEEVPPVYPSLHYAICRHWAGGRDVVIEVDAQQWQVAWRAMEPVMGVMEALGVPYTLRYSGHCSPHLCVAEEEFPEVTDLAEALRSNEQLISDLGRRLNPYGAIYLWPIARLPFSLNENTGFACLEVASPTAGAFDPSQAHPEQVQIATAWPPEQGRLGARPLLEWARGEREVEPTPVSLFTSAAPTPASVRRREDCESDWTRSRCVLREKMRSADASLANAPPAPAGMTLIPAGPFITGTPWTTYELGQPPLSIVELGAFFLDLTPVTSAQYQVFIDDRGYRRQELWSPEGWAFLQAAGWEGPMAPCTEGPPDLPARGLSAFEAEAYARWAGKRIPTFAEWEKACRGIDGRRWPWGDDFDESRCNTADGRPSDEDWAPTPVGAFSAGASPYGCLDMVGNVWEWVQGGVCIGGSFVSHLRNSSCCEHHGVEPHARTAKLGFRCAQDVGR
jgi:formylglycine-generating enzyme required for sulfatase activity